MKSPARLGLMLATLVILAQVAVANFGVQGCFGNHAGRAETPYLLVLLGLLTGGIVASLWTLRQDRLAWGSLFANWVAFMCVMLPTHVLRWGPIRALWP